MRAMAAASGSSAKNSRSVDGGRVAHAVERWLRGRHGWSRASSARLTPQRRQRAGRARQQVDADVAQPEVRRQAQRHQRRERRRRSARPGRRSARRRCSGSCGSKLAVTAPAAWPYDRPSSTKPTRMKTSCPSVAAVEQRRREAAEHRDQRRPARPACGAGRCGRRSRPRRRCRRPPRTAPIIWMHEELGDRLRANTA